MFRLAVDAAHKEVATGVNLQRSVPLARPVGDHQPLVSKVLAQDFGQEVVAFLGIDAVEKVIGGHDGPGGRFPQANLKAPGVKFPQSPGVHAGVSVQPVGLLAIGGKMFGRCTGAGFLDAVDIGGGDGAAQDGILREVFEVSSVQRVAQKVHSGPQDDIGPHIQRLFPYAVANLVCDSPVPGGGRQKAGREAGGEMGLAPAVVPIGLQPYAHRAVHHDDGRDAVFGEGVREASGSGKTGIVSFAGAVEAHHQEGLFLCAHRLHDGGNVVIAQFRLGRQACCKEDAAQE